MIGFINGCKQAVNSYCLSLVPGICHLGEKDTLFGHDVMNLGGHSNRIIALFGWLIHCVCYACLNYSHDRVRFYL